MRRPARPVTSWKATTKYAPWGFLGLRIPTKENVLALIQVALHWSL